MIEDPARTSAEGVARRARWSALPLIALVRLYQWTLSPIIGGQCKYVPTCSCYAIDALREHGAIRGAWLAARRVLRCHPLAKGGYDPVPPKS